MERTTIMPFGDHLEELRRRLIWSFLGILPILITCLFFGGPIIQFLLVPLLDALAGAGEPTQLLATGPLETFAAYLKVSTIISVLVATPWLVLQLWLFIAPGLYRQERRFVYFLVPLSGVLTAIGMIFLYKILLPISLAFLIIFGTTLVKSSTPSVEIPPGTVFPTIPSFEGDIDPTSVPEGSMWVNSKLRELRIATSDGIRGIRLTGKGAISQQYKIGEYISLVFTLGLVFAVAFQLPLALMLLSWAGILRASDLTPYRRHAGLAAGAMGALLTPQDPASMVLLAVALYLLFEFGLVLMRFVPARAVSGGFGLIGGKGTDGQEGDE